MSQVKKAKLVLRANSLRKMLGLHSDVRITGAATSQDPFTVQIFLESERFGYVPEEAESPIVNSSEVRWDT